MADVITNAVNSFISGLSHIFVPVSQQTAIIKNAAGQSVLVPAGQTTTSYSGGGINPGGNVPTLINPSQYGFSQTIPTAPSQLTPASQFGGGSAYWGGAGVQGSAASQFAGGTLAAQQQASTGGNIAAQQQASTGGNIAVQQQASTGGSAASSLSSYLASQQGGISSASDIAAILKSGTLEGASAYSPNYLNASIQPSQNKSFWSKFIDNTVTEPTIPNAPSYNPNVSNNLASGTFNTSSNIRGMY